MKSVKVKRVVTFNVRYDETRPGNRALAMQAVRDMVNDRNSIPYGMAGSGYEITRVIRST